jgi:hypothetical protein
MDDEDDLEKWRATLRRLLAARFGPLMESLSRRIKAASDLTRLRAAVDQALQMQRLDDLNL